MRKERERERGRIPTANRRPSNPVIRRLIIEREEREGAGERGRE